MRKRSISLSKFGTKSELQAQYHLLKLEAKLWGKDKDYGPIFEGFALATTIAGYEEILDPEHRIETEQDEDEYSPRKERGDNYGSTQCWQCGSYKRSPFDVCYECGED